jgi:hypothetical protein
MWAAGALAVVVAFLALSAVLPRGGAPRSTLRPGRPQVVAPIEAVPLTASRRRAIDSLLDAFVPAVVERRDPARALPLVTTAFKEGLSRRDWERGNLPVMPYDARGTRFDSWTLDYSLAREMSVDLLLRPAPAETRGNVAFTAVFRKERGRWRVDSFVPAASFAPESAPVKRISAQPDFTPAAKGGG